MTSQLTVEMCPEVLTDELLTVFRVKLKIATVIEFLLSNPLQLAASCGLNLKDVQSVRSRLYDKYSVSITNVGLLYLNGTLVTRTPIDTGLEDLDNLSSNATGMFQPGHIFEIFGCPGTGKTQFSIFLSVKTIMSDNHNVLYLDTRNDFCVERFVQLLDENLPETTSALTRASLMAKIRVCRVHKLSILDQILNALLEQNDDDFIQDSRLLVIDNISSLVMPLLKDNQMTSVFGSVGKVVCLLRKLASNLQLTVVVVNNATTTSKEESNRLGPFKPTLGKIFSDVCDTRLFFENISQNHSGEQVCKLTLTKSSTSPTGKSCYVNLTKSGFAPIKKK